ncbi:MAG: hypothetical protein HFJ28_02885 [Clostridia bacterium]|nr:hypothetical protein [Clostridia bacterium]
MLNLKEKIKKGTYKKNTLLLEKSKEKTAGITLIALVVTIIVLLILAGITIGVLFRDGGIIDQANATAFKTKMSAYRDKVAVYVSWKIADTQNTDITHINSGEILKEMINIKFINDIKVEDVSIPIKEIIDDIGKKEEDYVVVYKGEIYYVSTTRVANNEKQVQWCKEIGIKILDYTPASGIDIKDGSYEKVKDVWLCTPDLSVGFVPEKTRYMVLDKNGSMVPGDWIIERPDKDWYDYANSKWANIYVESDGADCYYVWIPRYCFKLDQTSQRSDVKLIDINNNYKDKDDNVTEWKELEEDGYQVPDAFTFDGKPLPGYWAMKYTAADYGVNQTILNFQMAVEKKIVTIRDITLKTDVTNSNPIVKYTVALNGVIVQTITSKEEVENIGSKVIQFSGIRVGNNTINVTGLNAKGEIVGSMTQEYALSAPNAPVFTGFNEDTTFYVTYDENGKEHSNIPITKAPPGDWYDYGSRYWANIVTRNNGQEVYYVWIPRYQFKLDQNNEKAIVEFVAGKSTVVKEGFQIPDAFTFGEEELTGYWAMKYTAADIDTSSQFDTETVTTANTIRTLGITGTGTATAGLKYRYYLEGEYRGEKDTAAEEFEYTVPVAGKEYTIMIEIRDSNDDYLACIIKKIKTSEVNKPNLSGFNVNQTYYVLYDDDGNEKIGSKVTRDSSGNPTNAPSDWYNYGKKKWANIVVTDGTVTNGSITGASKTTYFVWIPRYQFKLNQTTQRSTVEFISGTGTAVNDSSWQIPEAFTFGDQQLTGYWAMKYTAADIN